MRSAAWARSGAIIGLSLSLVYSPAAVLADEPPARDPGLRTAPASPAGVRHEPALARTIHWNGVAPPFRGVGFDEVPGKSREEVEEAGISLSDGSVLRHLASVDEISAHAPWVAIPLLAMTVASTLLFALLWHRKRYQIRRLKQSETSLRAQTEVLRRRLDKLEADTSDSSDERGHPNGQAGGFSQDNLDFLSMLGHELRTPLNSVLGFAEVLKGHPALAGLGVPSTYLDHIYNSGTHLARLVDDMLDLSRLESGRLVVDPTTVPIDLVLDQAVVTTALLASETDVTVTTRVSEPDALVRADATRLRQILINLLTNGIKYNRAGGSVQIASNDKAAPDRLQIEVSDTGSGIAPDQVERLFEPFERLAPQQADGIGIGLALSKRLAERMGGRLGYRPAETGGSVFWLDLPRAAPASDPGPPKA